MKIDCLLAGVGGQGTVLASKIIAQTAIGNHTFVRTSETIGMAQRGGCVVSHVRIDAENCSPSIPMGRADLIIGFEPAEAARSMGFLKSEGRLLVNTNPIIPVTASLAGSSYKVNDIIDYLRNARNKVVFVDGQKLCKAAGSSKVLICGHAWGSDKRRVASFFKRGGITYYSRKLAAKNYRTK